MSGKKVWFITGAGRGMGVDIAKAALDAGYQVVATGRNTDKVAKAVGESGMADTKTPLEPTKEPSATVIQHSKRALSRGASTHGNQKRASSGSLNV